MRGSEGLEDGIAKGIDALDGHRWGDAQAHAVAGVEDDEGIAFEAMDHGEADADQIRQHGKCLVDAFIECGEGCGGVCGEGREAIRR